MIDAIARLAKTILMDEFRKERRDATGSSDQAESDALEAEFRSWVVSNEKSAADALKHNRARAIKVLSENAIDGVFKPSDAANALQELLRQLGAAANVGINRFRLHNLPQIEQFLSEAVSKEPKRRSALVALVKLSQCHAPLAFAVGSALALLDGALLKGAVTTGRATLGRTKLHALVSRSERDGAAGGNSKLQVEVDILCQSAEGKSMLNAHDVFGSTPLDCMLSAGLRSGIHVVPGTPHRHSSVLVDCAVVCLLTVSLRWP